MFALPSWVWIIAICLVTGAAFWKGGPSERAGATFYLMAWLGTRAFRLDDRMATQYGTMVIDLILLVLLVRLSLRSDRYWPLCMTAFHLLAIITHIGRLADAQLSAWAYYTAAQIWGYLILASLAVGTWNTWNEKRQPATADAPSDVPGDTRL